MCAHVPALCALWVQVTYTWESLDGWSGIPAGGYTLKNLVLPPPVPAEAGQTYKLRLTARFSGSTAAATADVALTAVGSPLSASLLGPSGDVMGDKDIVLDASKSLDPDDPKVGLSLCKQPSASAAHVTDCYEPGGILTAAACCYQSLCGARPAAAQIPLCKAMH